MKRSRLKFKFYSEYYYSGHLFVAYICSLVARPAVKRNIFSIEQGVTCLEII